MNQLVLCMLLTSGTFCFIPSLLSGIVEMMVSAQIFTKIGPYVGLGLILSGLTNSIIYGLKHKEVKRAINQGLTTKILGVSTNKSPLSSRKITVPPSSKNISVWPQATQTNAAVRPEITHSQIMKINNQKKKGSVYGVGLADEGRSSGKEK